MLQAPNSENKVISILSKLTNPLRAAFATTSTDSFSDTLEITKIVKFHNYNIILVIRCSKR